MSTSIHQSAFDAAYESQVDDAKQFVTRGANINLVVIGASNFLEDLEAWRAEKTKDSNESNESNKFIKFESLTPAQIVEKEQNAKVLCKWALEQGACLLFSFTQLSRTRERKVTGQYGKNLSMLHGPGDLARGSLNQFLSNP